MNKSLPPINQRIKIYIDEKYNGNVSKFCADLGYETSQKVSRLFKIDGRTGKFPIPSTEVLIDISNLLEITIDELVKGRGGLDLPQSTSVSVRSEKKEKITLLKEPHLDSSGYNKRSSIPYKLAEYLDLRSKAEKLNHEADKLLIDILRDIDSK